MRLLVLVAAAAFAAAACRPDGPLPVADPRSASDALGEAKCHAVGPSDTPLVVDWRPHERTDLEAEMARGVAVVHYECGALRVLRGCTIEGTYRFLGTSKKEQIVKLEDTDDIAANLPAYGTKISAALDRSSSLDLAMVLVGKQRTTVASAEPAALRKETPDACTGATHFVRGAYVGAFALATGARGEASASVARIVEASTKGSKLSGFRDGDVAACDASMAGAASAPPGCGALVRLELAALDGAKTAEPTCPAGMALADGKCTQVKSAKTRGCKKKDLADCAARCEKELDATSCEAVGRLVQDKDPKRAIELFTRACDAGVAAGCQSLGYAYGEGVGVKADKARAATLYQRACDAPEPEPIACVNLATSYRWGYGVVKDAARALAIYRKACDAGEAAACFGLGAIYVEGATGVPKDELRALALFKQACDGGFGGGCHNAGAMYEEGTGVTANAERAIEHYKKGCALKHEESCSSLDYFKVKH